MSTPATPLPRALDPQNAALPPWKRELNERLREHRARRGPQSEPERGTEESGSRPDRASTSHVAARVAERYREAPSYRELLQASAAAAEAAAAAAQQASAAAEAVFSELAASQGGRAAEAQPASDPFADSFFTSAAAPDDPAPNPAPLFTTVEHHTPLPTRPALPARPSVVHRAQTLVDAFAEAIVPAAQSLPAKLIEFPRELIAARKQRPRLAEGPLLDGQAGELSPAVSLRIFEVEMNTDTRGAHADDRYSQEPSGLEGMDRMEARATGVPTRESLLAPMTDWTERESGPDAPRRSVPFVADHRKPATAPREHAVNGWGSIQLSAHPEAEAPPVAPASARRPEHGYKAEALPGLHGLAPVSDRFMAALVDAAIVGTCFLVSVLVFASCTVHPPAGKAALAGAALFLGVLSTFYGWLFMSFGGGSTPGMRYARIALCTFRDENPTRRELQGRVPATALALLPLGLGVLWALLDEDRLGWQDRMTRTYQRSYR